MNTNIIEATVVDADGEVIGTRQVEKLPLQMTAPVVTGQLGSVAIKAHEAATRVLGEIMAAKAEPRDMVAVEKEILNKCRDTFFAEKAIYFKPQGGGYVEGLGIFFAKALYSVYGNMHYETIEHSKSNTETQVQCTIWDKQRNNTRTETIIILHKKNNGGNLVSITDPDAIRLEGSRQKSYLERNCLLDGFDPGLIQKCFEQVIRTLDAASSAAMANPKETLNKYALQFGVPFGKLCAFLNIKNENGLKPMHCRRLLALYKAIAAEETTPQKVFGQTSIDLDAEAAKEEPPLTLTETQPDPATSGEKVKPARSRGSSTKAEPKQDSPAPAAESTKQATASEPAQNATTEPSLNTVSDSPAPSVQSAERDGDSPIAVKAPAAPLKQISLADNF